MPQKRPLSDTLRALLDRLGLGSILLASPFFPLIPGTKDMRQYPVFQGMLTYLSWKYYTHRLTRSGRWFFGMAVLLGMALIPGLDIPLYVPFVYLFGFLLVAETLALRNKPRVRLRALHASRVQAGSVLAIEVTVTHIGRFWPGMDLNILPARLPMPIDAAEPDGVPLGTLLPGESRRVRVGLLCRKRGTYRLRGFRVESDFPFGLLNAYGMFWMESDLTVYPDYRPLDSMEVPRGSRYLSGGQISTLAARGESFEYLGNREWREGDSVRNIDWRATGRHGGQPLAMREWREEHFQRVGMVVDSYLPPAAAIGRRPRAARETAFERAISVAAAAADCLDRQGYIVDFLAAGGKAHHAPGGGSRAAAGSGRGRLDPLLDILAGAAGDPRDSLKTIADALAEDIGQLTAVICIFLEWNAARREFVDDLLAYGVGVKIVLVRSGGEDALPFRLPLPPDAVVVEAGDRLPEAYL